MRARTLLYALGACSPAFLLALLGIQGRFLVLPWQPPEYGPEVSAHIYAYAPYLRHVATIRELPEGDLTPLAIAEQWAAAVDQGLLKEFPAADANDCGNTGVRAQIEEAKRTLLQSVFRLAVLAEKDDADRAAEIYSIALRLAPHGKYTSPQSIAFNSQIQRSALHRLNTLYPRLSGQSRAQITRQVLHVSTSLQKVEACYTHLATLRSIEPGAPSSRPSRPQYQFAVNKSGIELARNEAIDSEELIILTTFRQADAQERELRRELDLTLQIFAPFDPSEPKPVVKPPEIFANRSPNSVRKDQEAVIAQSELGLLVSQRRR